MKEGWPSRAKKQKDKLIGSISNFKMCPNTISLYMHASSAEITGTATVPGRILQ